MKHPASAAVVCVAFALLAGVSLVARHTLSKPAAPVPVASVCERVGDAITTLPPMQTAPVPIVKPTIKYKHKRTVKAKPHPPEVRPSFNPFGWIFGGM